MSQTQQSLRFHRNEYPVPGELVIAKNVKITELGVYVNLLEYGNLEGLVVIGELSRKRLRNIHKLIRINKIEVLSVLKVDKNKGYIDLSRKKVIDSDFNETYRFYTKNKIGHNIIVSVASRMNEDPLKYYEEWAWDKAETYKSLFDYFGYILDAYNLTQGTVQEKVLNESDEENNSEESTEIETNKKPKYNLDDLLSGIPTNLHSLLIEQISIKYNIQKVKIRADVDLTCHGPEGINAIREALKVADNTEEIEITLIKPPTYSIALFSDNIQKGKDQLKDALKQIKNKFETFKGTQFEEVSFKVYGMKDRKLDEDSSEQEETQK